MKRYFFILLFTVSAAAVSFAQNYTVQEVSGRVEKSLGNNTWGIVKAGDILNADTVIRTGMDAYVTVKTGEQVLRIDSSKTGKIPELGGGGSVIRIQGRISETDTSAVKRITGRVASGSARASNAADEIEIDED